MIFDDAETLLIDFLLKQMDTTVPVGSRVPEKAKAFIRIRRVGGSILHRVTDKARLAVECYSPSDIDAAALAGEVRDVLSLITRGGSGVHALRVQEESGPESLPDPHHNSHRYSLTYAIQLRGSKSERTLKQ
jgi:hypothetical protein